MPATEIVSAQFIVDLMAISAVKPTVEFHEKRKTPRFSLQVPVVCRALNTQREPTGTVFRGITLNISASGLMLATKAKVFMDSVPFLQLQFTAENDKGICKLLKVLRYAEHDSRQAIAGKFIVMG